MNRIKDKVQQIHDAVIGVKQVRRQFNYQFDKVVEETLASCLSPRS